MCGVYFIVSLVSGISLTCRLDNVFNVFNRLAVTYFFVFSCSFLIPFFVCLSDQNEFSSQSNRILFDFRRHCLDQVPMLGLTSKCRWQNAIDSNCSFRFIFSVLFLSFFNSNSSRWHSVVKNVDEQVCRSFPLCEFQVTIHCEATD